jgi:hypothetical protein
VAYHRFSIAAITIITAKNPIPNQNSAWRDAGSGWVGSSRSSKIREAWRPSFGLAASPATRLP